VDWYWATYDIEGNNLAVRLLDFPQLHQEIPESRLCDHRVWSEYAHAVELGCGVRLGW
jgi:hypothetical protein